MVYVISELLDEKSTGYNDGLVNFKGAIKIYFYSDDSFSGAEVEIEQSLEALLNKLLISWHFTQRTVLARKEVGATRMYWLLPPFGFL